MDSANCSSAYSHSPQNGFVAAGGHVNLLDTGACLGHVLQDVLHATRADAWAEAQVDLFQVLRRHANERESHIFVPHGICKPAQIELGCGLEGIERDIKLVTKWEDLCKRSIGSQKRKERFQDLLKL